MTNNDILFIGNLTNKLNGLTSLSVNRLQLVESDLGEIVINMTIKSKKAIFDSNKIASMSIKDVQKHISKQLTDAMITPYVYDESMGKEFLIHLGDKSMLIAEFSEHIRVVNTDKMTEILFYDASEVNESPEEVLGAIFAKLKY